MIRMLDMADLTYKQRKTGRVMIVGDWETTRRTILERSGWYLEQPPKPASSIQGPPEARVDLTTITGISTEIQDALYAVGVVTLDDLRNASDEQLLAISGIGQATLKKIRRQL